MSLNNFTRTLPYDSAAVQARLAAAAQAIAAGSGAVSSKFYAHTQLQIYGVTFITTTAGTSTYSYNGSATSPATVISALHVYNTNTTGTAVTLATDTIGPFIVGGTATALQTNVGGTSGGIAGGYQGPYALNTLGGTNTSQVFGTNTFVTGTATGSQIQSGYPGGGVGFGGLPMNPGDALYFVNGTDATAATTCILQYGLAPTSGQIVA
jgi:hypothetical protein